MALIDYANRRHDYLAVQPNPTIKNKLDLELFNSRTSGAVCVGIQKLAQRWLLEFMTELGSMPGLPQRGCEFMTAARAGRFLTKVNVAVEFARSSVDVRRNLAADEYDGMPDDERFLSAELVATTVVPENVAGAKTATSATYLTLTVKINSVAGESRKIIAPIEIVPQV